MQDLNQLQAYLRQFHSPKNLSMVLNVEVSEWVRLPEHTHITKVMFVTRVVGESMNKRIINGS
jgi:hypothetical protein